MFVDGICCAFVIEELPTSFSVALLHLWFCWFGLVRDEILQPLNPKDREREYHPCVNLHQEEEFQLPWNCVKLKSVSCTSNFLVRTCDFRKCKEFLLMLTSSLQGLLRNQSLETILICNVVLCFPHKNIMPVFTCVMNVRDQTRQTFVTCFCSFRYRTSKFVHRPQNIKSTNTCKI